VPQLQPKSKSSRLSCPRDVSTGDVAILARPSADDEPMNFPTTSVAFLKFWAFFAVPCSFALVVLAPLWVSVLGHAVFAALLAGGLQTVADAKFERSATH